MGTLYELKCSGCGYQYEGAGGQMMILGREYPRWNTRNPLSSRGEQFLQNLQRLSFGEISWADKGVFVDELELPPRHEAEKGGAPDQAVIWTNR